MWRDYQSGAVEIKNVAERRQLKSVTGKTGHVMPAFADNAGHFHLGPTLWAILQERPRTLTEKPIDVILAKFKWLDFILCIFYLYPHPAAGED